MRGTQPGQVWCTLIPHQLNGGIHQEIVQYYILSTCYTVGGMPLAFMQENFLLVCNYVRERTGCNKQTCSIHTSSYNSSHSASWQLEPFFLKFSLNILPKLQSTKKLLYYQTFKNQKCY